VPTNDKTSVQVGDRRLAISNLSKILYPATGFTKGEVLDYYSRVAPVLLPHLAGRPLTRKRYPNGVDGPSFFEKNAPRGTPEWVRTVTLPVPGSTKNRETIDYVIVDELATLVWTANLASLELHVPQWRVDRAGVVQDADLLVLDLDPGPPANVVDCCCIALQLREMFEHFDLHCFPKTTGSKGLQVYLPLNTKSHYDETKPFARALAQLLEKQTGQVVSKMSKEIRKGKVFVDWSQNHPRKTTVAVYSMRARERPTVSTPVSWDEVERCAKKEDPELLVFEASEVLNRVEKDGDLFAPVLELKQTLPSFSKLAGAA